MFKTECFADLLNSSGIPIEILEEKGDVGLETKCVSRDGLNRFVEYELRRLNRIFTQGHRNKILTRVPILSVSDEIIGWRSERITVEGRIIRRRHSHDRSWGERHWDHRPRSVLVASSWGSPDEESFYWLAGDNVFMEPSSLATEEDWENLLRVNAGWQEPTSQP